MVPSSHSLVEIKPSDWKDLQKLYEDRRTQSTGYYLIDNYIKWLESIPDLDIKCLSLDGDWRKDGTFIFLVKNARLQTDVFLNTLNDNLERLTKAVLCLKFPPDERLLFYGYGERLAAAVEAFKEKFVHFQLKTVSSVFYHADKELVKSFASEPPEGLQLCNLTVADVATVNSHWPHRFEGSEEYVKRLILHNTSVGICDESRKLIGWSIVTPIGAIGLLHIMDSHKRQGLGSFLIRQLAKKIVALDGEVYAPVLAVNTPSRKMLDRTSDMLATTHCLVEISPSEWYKLLQLYAGRKLESPAYYLIENYIEWLAKEPALDIKCYALDADWQDDGTFIMIANNGPKHRAVFFNTLSDNLARLSQALLCMPYKVEDICLYGYVGRLLPAVEPLLTKVANLHMLETHWLRASKEIIANFSTEPPAGIQLRSLTSEDAATINEVWPHRSEGSVSFVRRMILYNVSVGAYDSDDKLVAWCLRLPIGSLGLLQVLDTHKRLGLGSLMVRYMSKEISALGDEVLAGVVKENTPSLRMFQKLGFQLIDTVYWT